MQKTRGRLSNFAFIISRRRSPVLPQMGLANRSGWYYWRSQGILEMRYNRGDKGRPPKTAPKKWTRWGRHWSVSLIKIHQQHVNRKQLQVPWETSLAHLSNKIKKWKLHHTFKGFLSWQAYTWESRRLPTLTNCVKNNGLFKKEGTPSFLAANFLSTPTNVGFLISLPGTCCYLMGCLRKGSGQNILSESTERTDFPKWTRPSWPTSSMLLEDRPKIWSIPMYKSRLQA